MSALAPLLLLLLLRTACCDYSVITATSGVLSSASTLFSTLISSTAQRTQASTPPVPVPAPPVCFTDRAAYPLTSVPAWTLVQGSSPVNDTLLREYPSSLTRDFRTAFAFMSAAAVLADVNNHHPLWTNVYNSVKVGAWPRAGPCVHARARHSARPAPFFLTPPTASLWRPSRRAVLSTDDKPCLSQLDFNLAAAMDTLWGLYACGAQNCSGSGLCQPGTAACACSPGFGGAQCSAGAPQPAPAKAFLSTPAGIAAVAAPLGAAALALAAYAAFACGLLRRCQCARRDGDAAAAAFIPPKGAGYGSGMADNPFRY